MSFIALALTLCTAIGSDDKCNTYYIDAFAGVEVAGQPTITRPLADQWVDCFDRTSEETLLAKLAAKRDGASRPSAKDGVSTGYRQAYLARFNITEKVKDIDSWEFSCIKVKESETP